MLHGVERPAVVGRAPIQETRDIGVLQLCKNLTFRLEAPENLLRIHARLNELESHLLIEVPIGSLGQKHITHAAGAQLFQDTVVTDSAAQSFWLRFKFYSLGRYAIEENLRG